MASTRTLVGIGLILLGTGMLVFGLLPTLSAFSALLAVAAVFLTAGTYLIGTDVSGRVV